MRVDDVAGSVISGRPYRGGHDVLAREAQAHRPRVGAQRGLGHRVAHKVRAELDADAVTHVGGPQGETVGAHYVGLESGRRVDDKKSSNRDWSVTYHQSE
jgi:hypothetical protein